MYVCGKKLVGSFLSHVVMAAALLCVGSLAHATGEAVQSFTYQGRFMNAAGTMPLTGNVDIKFQIYDPTEQCLLLEETDTNINLTASSGSVAVRIGAGTRTGTDPGLALATIFANNAAANIVPAAGACPGYKPTGGQYRYLHVVVSQGGVATPLSPDQIINSVPEAIVAETVQGVALSGLIQVTSTITQTNLGTLTAGSTSDASNLHNHDTHNDARYARLGANDNFGTSNLSTNGDIGIGTSSPSADLDIERATPDIKIASTTNTGNPSSIDFYGNGTETASIQSRDNSNTLYLYTGGAQAMEIDSSQNAIFSHSIALGGTLGLAQLSNAQETTLVTSLTAMGFTAQGAMWENTSSHAIKYWDGAAAQTVAIAGSGTTSLANGGTNANLTAVNGGSVYSTGSALAITAAGTSGQFLMSNGAAAPTWSNVPQSLNADPGTPATGQMWYNSTSKFLKYYDGTSVQTLGIATGTATSLTNGGTNASLTAVAGGAVYSTGSALAITAAGTAGQVLTSNGAAAPTWQASPQIFPADPGGPTAGEVWYNSSTKLLKYFDGSAVQTVGTASGGSYLPEAGGTMSGTLNMNSNRITNLPSPSAGSDPVTETYANSTYLPLSGGTLTGNLNLSASTLFQLGAYGTDPSSPSAGQVWYNSNTNQVKYFDGTSVQAFGVSGGGTTALANGGTNANLTAVAGGAVYSTGSAMAITAAGTSGQFLMSNGAAAPTWSSVPQSLSADPGTPATGQMWYNSTSKLVKYYDGTATQVLGTASGSSQWTTSGSNIYYSVSGGHVGIGTASPSAMLQVAGDSVINGLTVGLGASNVAGNTAVGVSALASNTTGSVNTALGYMALNANTTGVNNTALGYEAMIFNTTGGRNLAVGDHTLLSNTTGSNNTAVGGDAVGGTLAHNTTGSSNTALGHDSGGAITTGSNNVTIGESVGNTTLNTGSNNILIGTSSSVDTASTSTSNSLNIGNTIFATGMTGTVAAPAGSVGIGVVAPAGTLDVEGGGSATICLNGGCVTSLASSSGPSLTAGSVAFGNGTGLTQDNANFFYNGTNKWLGVGLNAKTNGAHLEVSWQSGDSLPTAYFGSSNTSNTMDGVFGVSNSGAAIHGQSNTGNGVYGYSTSGPGVYAQSYSSEGIAATSSSSSSGYFQTSNSTGTNTAPTLAVRDGTSQTAPLFQAQDSAGGTLMSINSTGDIDLMANGGTLHYIHDLHDPSAAQDAATKNWVSTNFAAAGGSGPALTAGAVAFGNGTGITQDASNFYYDSTNHFLGVGTSTEGVGSRMEVGWGAGDTHPTAWFGSNSPGDDQTAIVASTGSGTAFVAQSQAGTSAFFGSNNISNTSPTVEIQQAGSSTADLLQIRDSTNANLISVASTGDMTMGTGTTYHYIHNLHDPSAAQDAATKNWVATNFAASGGAGPALTTGSVAFGNGTGVTQDNANFFYNSTAKWLGIGASSQTFGARMDTLWQSGDTLPTAFFGSTSASDNQDALSAISHSGRGINAESSTGSGVAAFSDSGSGVFATSNSGIAILAKSSTGVSGVFQSSNSANTSATVVIALQTGQTSTLLQMNDGSGVAMDIFKANGDLDMGPSGTTHFIHDVSDPSANQDVATKNYVLSVAASGAGALVTTDGATPMLAQWDFGNKNLVDVKGLSLGSASAPAAALDITGSLYARSLSNSSGAIDFSKANAIYTSAVPSAVSITNMQDGGSYTLVVQNSDGSTLPSTPQSSLTFKFAPANGATTSGTDTVYTFIRVGTTVYVSWISGF